jgi:hypothetical protein
VDVTAGMRVSRWGVVGLRVEDAAYATSVNAYTHVEFRDDDIAYILGLVGLARQ